MAKTLDDLTDEEYDAIMDARNRAAKEAVVGTIMGRVPRSGAYNNNQIRSWLNTWDYASLQRLVELYNPTPVVRRDEDEDDVRLTNVTFNTAAAWDEPIPVARGR